MTHQAPPQLLTTHAFSYVSYPDPDDVAEAVAAWRESATGGRATASWVEWLAHAVQAFLSRSDLRRGDLTTRSRASWWWGGPAVNSDLRTDTSSIQFASAAEPPDEEAALLFAPWVQDAALRLLQLQALPLDWDSYGGRPLDDEHALIAWRFLARFMSTDLPLPDFVPLANGGLQLEWDISGTELSFTTDEESPAVVWLTTPEGSEEVPWPDVPFAFQRLRGLLSAARPFGG